MAISRCCRHFICEQTGASLIALMIGMLVSVLSILAVMTMHKSLVQVAVEAKQDSSHDGLLNSTMVQLQTALHNAGYGMEDASGDDVVTDDDGGTTPSLLWRYRDTSMECVRVQDETFTDADTQKAGRRLVMTSLSGCAEDADLATMNWGGGTAVTLATFKDQASPLFSFTKSEKLCSPFGFSDPDALEKHVLVSVSAQSSAEQDGAAVSAINYDYCLANTHFN